jgi:hypothetical protein
MVKVAQVKTPELIANKKEFNASELTATNDGIIYRVWSFRTVIAQYDLIDKVWIINNTRYSMHTAKHQSFVKRAFSHSDYEHNTVHVYHVARGTDRLDSYWGEGSLDRYNRIKKEGHNL